MPKHTVPLDVLVRAAAALKAAKDVPVQTVMPVSVWAEINRSHSELKVFLEFLLRDQSVSVAIPA